MQIKKRNKLYIMVYPDGTETKLWGLLRAKDTDYIEAIIAGLNAPTASQRAEALKAILWLDAFEVSQASGDFKALEGMAKVQDKTKKATFDARNAKARDVLTKHERAGMPLDISCDDNTFPKMAEEHQALKKIRRLKSDF